MIEVEPNAFGGTVVVESEYRCIRYDTCSSTEIQTRRARADSEMENVDVELGPVPSNLASVNDLSSVAGELLALGGGCVAEKEQVHAWVARKLAHDS